MRIKPKKILKIAVIVMVVLVGTFATLALLSSALRHEVTETSTDVAAIEGYFPTLAGHVESADWSIQYIADPLPIVPGPTDYKIWGHVTIDDEFSEHLLRRYEWTNTLLSMSDAKLLGDDGDASRKWLTNLEFNRTAMGSFVGNMYFDGYDTLSFSGCTM